MNAAPTVGRPPVRVDVPGDSAALALGADAVSAAIQRLAALRGTPVSIVRTGSRGACWLEPLVEVTTPAGRIAYGPVTAAEVPALLDAGMLAGGNHRLRIGDVAALPWFTRQQRLTCARLGVVDPASLEDYARHGGLAGLRAALAMTAEDIVHAVTESGLRGRGGAAFPTGLKWRTTLQQAATRKYVACNADEGDSGTFADRMLLEGDPFVVIEGMVIAGLATGAREGFVYLRAEYPHAARAFARALDVARSAGMLGPDVLGSGQAFDIALRLGAGAYVCGEETSMLESLEGRRGEVRARPPLPAVKGLFGAPTAVNNVVTLASVPFILANGPAGYRDLGAGRSRGTLPLQLGGNVRRGGLVEHAFGLSLRELVEEFGGGTATGRPLRAVQVGGPLGAFLPVSALDLPLDYEALSAAGALLGHGGVVVFDDSVDLSEMALHALEFCAHESCGKCTPCRIGSVRGAELLARVRHGEGDREAQLALLDELCEVMLQGSLCGLGGMTPLPVRSAIRHFPEDFRRSAAPG
jgi:formate dehydrogenase iron-sulfur subunit